MVKFIDLNPNDVKDSVFGQRGRVSYPILKAFLETGKYIVQLDRTGMQQSYQGLYSCLGSYIRNHRLPIKLLSRGGEIILMRLDIDEDGNQIPNWEEIQLMTLVSGDPMEITSDEVERRYLEEKGKVGK